MQSVPGMTSEELKNSIKAWMQTKYKLDVEYDEIESVKQLEDFGLLTRRTLSK